MESVSPPYQKTRARVRRAVFFFSAMIVPVAVFVLLSWFDCFPHYHKQLPEEVGTMYVAEMRDAERCVRIPSHGLPVLLPENLWREENQRIQGWYSALADSLIDLERVEGDKCRERPYCCADGLWLEYDTESMLGMYFEPQPFEIVKGGVVLRAAIFPAGDGTLHLVKEIRIGYDD